MRRLMMSMRGRNCLAALGLLLACGAFAEDEAALPGERALSSEATAKRLVELAERFKQAQAVSAKIVTEVDDLIGKRTEEGELLFDGGGRILRRFEKPALKTWRLDGPLLEEYSARQKTVYIKDFSKAPKALRLIQAAVKVDIAALGDFFDVRVFESGDAAKPALRLVLLKKNTPARPMLYKRIQARIGPDEPFFSEIEYLPESGDRTLEKFLNIRKIERPAAEAFKVEYPPETVKKVDQVGELE